MAEEYVKQSKEEFDADMERSWQEMLSGGGTPFEEFWGNFEKEFDNEVQVDNDVIGSGKSA